MTVNAEGIVSERDGPRYNMNTFQHDASADAQRSAAEKFRLRYMCPLVTSRALALSHTSSSADL